MSHNSSDLDKIETKSVANLETVSLSAPGSSNDLFGVDDSQLHRSLKDRHIGMIALVSVFGTGLFLSSGGTLAKTGPVGMLIAYAIIGVVVGLNQLAMAETAALAPLTGASIRHAEIFIDEAVGFALGYLKLWQNLLPGGVVSAALVIQYWSDLSPAVWITVLAVPIAVTNLFSIRIYGEVEFVFGMLKICLIVMLVLAGLVLDLGGVKGQERLGFHYWKDPGPFAAFIESGAVGRFVGFWAALSSVVYSYGGVQGIALLAGETKNPRTNIPKAAKRILYRVVGLYMVAVFVLTLIVPYDDKKIAVSDGTAAHSPYVIAFERAGIKVLPHVVNALTLTSAWSEGNASVANSARILFSLASKGQAPRVFLRSNARLRVPFVGVSVALVLLALAYMCVDSTAATVFSWFQNITSSVLLLDWIVIAANHIRMSRALAAQGYTRAALPYRNRAAPVGAWVSLVASVVLLVTGGFTTFLRGHWSTSTLVSAYCSPVLFVVLYAGWKVVRGTRQVPLEEVCIGALLEDYRTRPEEGEPETAKPAKRVAKKVVSFLWS
ncbi:salicylate hydroxylase [Ogataea parapolymorpha DL-1]|uniref:Salicylate hydroxylase n=1 Tax=Ogataea parapolymorpha (strain ATCC 26012 / BCRC 20466 / JCM 22074 / NRRL Y-7560 / DL-1) TaxID=871575 RepID=W1Q9E1_OGAPD|nr:salicylate hydroxylase [Ogataea parapolymorpha DL-1]ESW96631.1 salicylate hydroxylase [Ogataea parapolymorpha DL-1]